MDAGDRPGLAHLDGPGMRKRRPALTCEGSRSGDECVKSRALHAAEAISSGLARPPITLSKSRTILQTKDCKKRGIGHGAGIANGLILHALSRANLPKGRDAKFPIQRAHGAPQDSGTANVPQRARPRSGDLLGIGALHAARANDFAAEEAR
jgi:hypothetical protein